MELQRIRILLFVGLSLLGFMLYSAWQQEHVIPARVAQAQAVDTDLPTIQAHSSSNMSAGNQLAPMLPAKDVPNPERLISVKTDVFDLKIDLKGGDIVYAALPQYSQKLGEQDNPFILLDTTVDRYYTVQSGFMGEFAPDSQTEGRGIYKSAQKHYESNGDLSVDLIWQHPKKDIEVTKRYHFQSENYLVSVDYLVDNNTSDNWEGTFYSQIKREKREQKSGLVGMQMYQGGAYSTEDKPYKKISYDKMKDSPLHRSVDGGWIAMLEHYFLTAWVPAADQSHTYYTRADQDNRYYIGTVDAPTVVGPGATAGVSTQLYMGPESTDVLKEISPGLELTVDYGILWPISQLLFWLLKNIYSFVGNWGWSIILVTVAIKAAFYKLSAASYRSMGNMRRLQPQIKTLKDACGEDKQKFSQEMMGLYRKEKVNPLGGCLPILVQIPVFIALYYVLLESVELRHSPFIFWLHDLSSKDPFYVLPIIMGATMLIQQRLNPAPPDPIQAKVMMAMPIVFTILFLQFPAGLVLYWVVNSSLSIIQQWLIMRRIAA